VVPAALARLIRRTLVVDPRQRPTAEQLRRQLDAFVRHRVRRIGLVLAAGVVFGLAGLAGVLRPTGDGPAPVAATRDPSGIAPEPAPAPGSGAASAVVKQPATDATSQKEEEKDPKEPHEFFARGVRLLKEGNRKAAFSCFEHAVLGPDGKPDGRTLAYLAYCADNPRLAMGHYAAAIENGYDGAWVRNNYAYSLFAVAQTRRTYAPQELKAARDDRRKAIDDATAAIGKDKTLRAAYYNRAYARFRLKFDVTTLTLDDPDGLCAADVEQVMARRGPVNAELFYIAAEILLTTDPGRPDYRDRVFDYLNRAVDLGKPPMAFAGDEVLAKYLTYDSRFQELTRRAAVAPPKSPPANPQLVAPPDL